MRLLRVLVRPWFYGWLWCAITGLMVWYGATAGLNWLAAWFGLPACIIAWTNVLQAAQLAWIILALSELLQRGYLEDCRRQRRDRAGRDEREDDEDDEEEDDDDEPTPDPFGPGGIALSRPSATEQGFLEQSCRPGPAGGGL